MGGARGPGPCSRADSRWVVALDSYAWRRPVSHTAASLATAPSLQATAALEPLPLHALPPAPEPTEETFASSSSAGEPVDVESLGEAEEVFFLRAKSGIIHVAAPSELCVGVQHSSLWMQPACGMLSAELAVVASVPTGARLCKHKACQGLLSSCA